METYISRKDWDEIYTKLYEVYELCSQTYNETYRQKIGIVLDHMITNKPHLNIK